MDTNVSISALAPFSLKDAPALIERVFPAQKIGIESQKERKAGAGQTLTALGSYWKGRKPLVLVRATVLASLLPATDDPEADLEVFDLLMRMDDEGMRRRKPKVSALHVFQSIALGASEWSGHISVPSEPTLMAGDQEPGDDDGPIVEAVRWIRPPKGTPRIEAAQIKDYRETLKHRAFDAMTFSQKVGIVSPVENVETIAVEHDPFYDGIWERVNTHLGTAAATLPELVEQLGIARFGHRPVVGDPFCGGGSIPFEAARIGADVVASDLNPVAAMLTWGALESLGADNAARQRISEDRRRVTGVIDAEIRRLGIEHNAIGDRAKAFLYCLEVIDPQTGWLVPVAGSWVIGRNRRCIAMLVPDYAKKRFDIRVEEGVSKSDVAIAANGSVDEDGQLCYRLAPVEGGKEREYRVPLTRLRGDGEGPVQADGSRANWLRPWAVDDIMPRPAVWDPDAEPIVRNARPGAWNGGDVWQERLYAIQWISSEDIAAGVHHPCSYFAAPDADDLRREDEINTLVSQSIADWQAAGLVPDMAIELGDETTRLIRERGWTHWHHLFSPRQLHYLALTKRELASGFGALHLANILNFWSKLCGIHPRSEGSGRDTCLDRVFINQALNTLVNYGVRASDYEASNFDASDFPYAPGRTSAVNVCTSTANELRADMWVYDPPYADAVNYHEITEYFIAWLRKRPPAPLDRWKWDSRRPMAIQGKGEKFRTEMVVSLHAMLEHMPDNGLQVCMFTHKDEGVWADMAGIVWAAGLRVSAAWYVSTETSSERKKGGYVQGTVLLILRKRATDEYGYRSDIVPEVRARVIIQVETLTGLNQRAQGSGRDENLFSDADIQMAGYAAALEVLTSYTHIDGVDMTREALRPREPGRRGQTPEIGLVEEMIALAVQTANELMVPDGLPDTMWERLGPTERFYLKMTAAEAGWPAANIGGKLDDYQNFAKAYRADGWEDLMADRTPNRARIKSATELRGAFIQGHPFSRGSLRPTLYAVMSLARDAAAEIDPETSGAQALHGLRDHFGDDEWLRARDNVRALAIWLGRTWERRNSREGSAARVLASLIASERL